MTAEDLMNLPDDDLRHELINGKLITMPLFGILHGRITMRLGVPLGQFVLRHDLGEPFISEVGYQLTKDPDTVLGSDISFISKERLKQIGEVEGYWQGPPDLAVEILNPEDDRGEKISQWLGFGTKQVWIVEPRDETVTVYRSETDIRTFSGSDYLEAEDLFPGFRLSLDKIFGATLRK